MVGKIVRYALVVLAGTVLLAASGSGQLPFPQFPLPTRIALTAVVFAAMALFAELLQLYLTWRNRRGWISSSRTVAGIFAGGLGAFAVVDDLLTVEYGRTPHLSPSRYVPPLAVAGGVLYLYFLAVVGCLVLAAVATLVAGPGRESPAPARPRPPAPPPAYADPYGEPVPRPQWGPPPAEVAPPARGGTGFDGNDLLNAVSFAGLAYSVASVSRSWVHAVAAAAAVAGVFAVRLANRRRGR